MRMCILESRHQQITITVNFAIPDNHRYLKLLKDIIVASALSHIQDTITTHPYLSGKDFPSFFHGEDPGVKKTNVHSVPPSNSLADRFSGPKLFGKSSSRLKI